MNKYTKMRFTAEVIIGILTIIAALLFGEKGMAVLALFALSLFIPRHKPDEREIQLYNKIGNLTAAFTLVACIAIFRFSDFAINNLPLGKNWLTFVVAFFMLSHGISGLIVFSRK